MNKHKKFIEKLLSKADVQINGDRPWDIKVHNDKFYSRIMSGGTLALGESYMDGWWDCEELDSFIDHVLRANLKRKIAINIPNAINYLSALIINSGRKKKAFEVGEKHYDTGNDLFSAMLDKRLVYTCAYWKRAKNLDEAQEHKLDLVCKKLNLKSGQKILDIGCGWGSFAKFAAERYGVEVVGITVSKEQQELGMKLCTGLPVEIRLQDYRDATGTFDHIVSLGMFEHVNVNQYRTFMKVVERCLKDDGLFLLHTIGGNITRRAGNPWLTKYIFPNGMLPSQIQITKATEGIFIMEDWHNFGPDYDKTLMVWFSNFDSHWYELKEKYGDRFYRMWKYYLLVCAGAFRARHMELWQIVLSKNGVRGGYVSIR